MSEEKKEKEKIIFKREISGVRERPRLREDYEQSGVRVRTTEKKKEKEE